MDNESSPTRSSKRRKSNESEQNDNQPESGTSCNLQNNNANSSVVVTGIKEIRKTSNEDKQIGDGSATGAEGKPEQEVDNAGNATLPPPNDDVNVTPVTPQTPPPPLEANVPPPSPPEEDENMFSDIFTEAAEAHFSSLSRRAAIRPRNYRSHMMTSSSSSSTSSDSLDGVILRETNRRQRSRSMGTSDSTESNLPTMELDSSITTDSDVNYFDIYHSSNDEETAAAEDVDLNAFNDVMNKPKPSYTWNSAFEIMHREHGLSGDGRRSLRNGISNGLQTRFYGSRHVVEKMKLLHSMHKHNGCVNCLNFNRAGNLLCTGSDDMKVVVWDWASNKSKFSYKSGHTENIFQTKFVEMNGCMDIVSSSRDGQVRGATIPPSGGKIRTRSLYKHHGAVHKLVLCPQNPFVVLSAGEDGKIVCYDLRKSPVNRLKTVKEDKRRVPLYSIAHHPFDSEICVCGNDNYVRVFDRRNMSKTVHKMSPQRLVELTNIPHITCCVYNSTGSEILASYSDDDIYLFNNKVYNSGQFNHRYKGHYNHKTIKGVNFFGPNSEYVISGSDCGNIFFWDKNTEAIINFMEGDNSGVVNCLEPHPSIPILATSGLDYNIKIWAPNSDTYPPTMSKLDKCVKRNLKRSVVEEVDGFDDRQFYYFVRQFLRNSRPSDNNDSSLNDTAEVEMSASSTSGSDEEYQFSNDQIARALRPSCNPQ